MIVVLNGENIKSREELHTFLAEAFHFPEWYGKNLDALYDCLGDLQENVELCVLEDKKLVEHLGNYGKAFFKVLRDVAKENDHLIVRGLE